MRDLAEISAASNNIIQSHTSTAHQPAPITLQELEVQTLRVLAPLYKSHQPPKVDTNVPRMHKSQQNSTWYNGVCSSDAQEIKCPRILG